MDFPPGYIIALTPEEIESNWPNLEKDNNFQFTSLKKKGYNCVAYAINQANKDLDMLVFAKLFDLAGNLDHSAKGYAMILTQYYGYEECKNAEAQDGYEKIALYEDINGDFKHLSKQLTSGKWTSKMGTYEDIEHDTLNDIAGDYYGHPVLFMKKKISK